MFAKPLLLAIIAACGVKQPPTPSEEPRGQHFCCQDVDFKTATGEGCQTISSQQVALCDTVLYCAGNWGKKDGKVACLD